MAQLSLQLSEAAVTAEGAYDPAQHSATSRDQRRASRWLLVKVTVVLMVTGGLLFAIFALASKVGRAHVHSHAQACSCMHKSSASLPYDMWSPEGQPHWPLPGRACCAHPRPPALAPATSSLYTYGSCVAAAARDGGRVQLWCCATMLFSRLCITSIARLAGEGSAR